MQVQFSIAVCLSFFTTGWYVVTKGNSLSAVLCFCRLRVDCPESKATSDRELSIYFFWIPACFKALFKVGKALFKCCF